MAKSEREVKQRINEFVAKYCRDEYYQELAELITWAQAQPTSATIDAVLEAVKVELGKAHLVSYERFVAVERAVRDRLAGIKPSGMQTQ